MLRPMPPTDRFVISFAAEPPQEGIPYGRWADTLAGHFLGACRELDTEGEEIGKYGANCDSFLDRVRKRIRLFANFQPVIRTIARMLFPSTIMPRI